MKWKLDKDGDWVLSGHGMVCPHHDGFIRVSCGGGDDYGDCDTIAEGKAYVEARAKGEEPAIVLRPFELPARTKKYVAFSKALVGALEGKQ